MCASIAVKRLFVAPETASPVADYPAGYFDYNAGGCGAHETLTIGRKGDSAGCAVTYSSEPPDSVHVLATAFMASGPQSSSSLLH